MSEVPWWAVPTVAGLATIFGVLISQYVAFRLEKARAARENSRRWDTNQREAYAALTKEARVIHKLFSYNAQQLLDGEITHWPDDFDDAFLGALSDLELLATPKALEAARLLHESFLSYLELWKLPEAVADAADKADQLESYQVAQRERRERVEELTKRSILIKKSAEDFRLSRLHFVDVVRKQFGVNA